MMNKATQEILAKAKWDVDFFYSHWKMGAIELRFINPGGF